MWTGQPAWLPSTSDIYCQTFLVVAQIWLLSWNSRGAFFSPTTVWKQKVVQGREPAASHPRCFDWAPRMETSENAGQGHTCPSQSWRVRRGEGVWRKHTLTFILNILVCRNLKLNILSTYTVKNPFIETKSNWRSKDWWPEMKYFKNKIYGD